MTRALVTCAAWLLAAAGAHAAPLTLEQLMQDLAARGDAAASFSEEQQLAALDRPVRSNGELRYRAPDELEKHTLKPREEILRYSGGVLSSERGGRRTRVDLQRYPQALPFVESIRATLAGDRPALEKLFELRLDGERAAWTLGLSPRDPQGRRLVRDIRIEGSGGDLRRVTIERPSGDRTITTMTRHDP